MKALRRLFAPCPFPRASVFLALVGVAVLVMTAWAQHPAMELAGAEPLEPEYCVGDESITFAPLQPAAGEELLVAVTSSVQHRGVWLASDERPLFLREYPGQLGTVWNWLIVPRQGLLQVRFFVDSTIFCSEASILIGPSTEPTPAPTATPTATPTVTGSPQPLIRIIRTRSSGGSRNRSSSDNDGGDNESVDPGTPQINSIEPANSCPGGELTIRGRSFGDSREDINGEVVIDEQEVETYLDWSDRKVQVLVPSGAKTGINRRVYLITDGGYDEGTVNLSAAPC
jgi:hypothetical protein